MTDDFAFLRSSRPDPEPDAAVTERHRTELQRRMGLAIAVPTDDDTGDTVYAERPLPHRPIRGTPRRWSIALIGVAAAVLVVAGGMSLATRDERPDDKAGKVRSTAPLTCSDHIPADVEVPGATSGPLVGPGPGSDPAEAGQHVVHWLRDEGMVELRWPAPPLGDYDDGSGWTSAVVPSEPFGRRFMGPQGEIAEEAVDDMPPDVELYVQATGKRFYPLGTDLGNVVGEGTSTETSGDPDLIVDITDHPLPQAGCEVVELRTIGPAGNVRSAFDLSDSMDNTYVGSLIDARETVGDQPKEPYSCRREPLPPWDTRAYLDDDAPVAGSNDVPPAQDPLPKPVDVLNRSVTQGGSGAPADGWTEWLEPDGTYTYTMPGGDPSRTLFYVITVAPSGDGWVSEEFLLGRC